MMNNANTPAMPLTLDTRVDESGNQFCNDAYEGLTKREHFAGLAMQGLLANSVMGDADLHESHLAWLEDITDASIEFADKLLKQLGEQNEQD